MVGLLLVDQDANGRVARAKKQKDTGDYVLNPRREVGQKKQDRMGKHPSESYGQSVTSLKSRLHLRYRRERQVRPLSP